MPRGRQYYDPIVQVPGTVEGENDLSRVEVFQDESFKWWGRQVAADGSLTGNRIGDFDHATLLNQVREAWPTLPVYELRNEGEDSTWEGHGPSPRLWQQAIENRQDMSSGGRAVAFLPESETSVPPTVEPTEEQGMLRLIPVEQPGAYVLLADICSLLEAWADSYESAKNPSGAMALREAVDTLKDIG